MSSPITIDLTKRTKEPCSPSCRAATCLAIIAEKRRQELDELAPKALKGSAYALARIVELAGGPPPHPSQIEVWDPLPKGLLKEEP